MYRHKPWYTITIIIYCAYYYWKSLQTGLGVSLRRFDQAMVGSPCRKPRSSTTRWNLRNEIRAVLCEFQWLPCCENGEPPSSAIFGTGKLRWECWLVFIASDFQTNQRSVGWRSPICWTIPLILGMWTAGGTPLVGSHKLKLMDPKTKCSGNLGSNCWTILFCTVEHGRLPH